MAKKASQEKQIESDILNWLMMKPNVFAWKNHTTGVFDPKKKVFRPLQGHSIRGVSDILGIVHPTGKMLAIEVKTPTTIKRWLKMNEPGFQPTSSQFKEYQRAKEQHDFLMKVQSFGGIADCVCSLEQAVDLISEAI